MYIFVAALTISLLFSGCATVSGLQTYDLPEQGYYKKADDIIQEVKSLQTFERGYLAIPLMFLEVEHVYNQFRWNRLEAIELARNLLNYLESAKFIDQNYYSNFIKAFTYHCQKLNKTGKELF